MQFLIPVVILCVSLVDSQKVLYNNEIGYNNGYYYAFWKDSGSATFTLESGGRYAGNWTTSTNNWVGGKGWNPGSSWRTVNYSGYYGINEYANSYLSLYGWTTNPLIEYYVVESYGSYSPLNCPGGTDEGSFTSGGATYQVRKCRRTNAPSIIGTQSFDQYFSVRTPKKGFGQVSGSVNFADHVQYWASRGLPLGTHAHQIFATEGYQSSGFADITVS
ncbi:unnamed protein product [Phaedon cochleariae]|uniref:endo-1,4-beta-xylanase n=1 Tax=Phaedon cochleariae TaxID=80249 RepID=A0A9P0GTC6_PHACE|nr:unnamed protein product [Phaedon cochleariae]